MYEYMGFHEGILLLPNGRPVPISIDHMNMSPDTVPKMSVSVIHGCRGHEMVRDFERRERAKHFLSNPFVLPNDKREIEKVIFNDPATIVIWKDKTKTVVKCQEGDTYSPELGLAMCIAKKYLGNKGNFNEVFKKWIQEEPGNSVEKMRTELDKYCESIPTFKCRECLIHGKSNSCNFSWKDNRGKYIVPDKTIRECYEIVFNKED